MPSITLSRRLLGCLLVILLSQVSNAAKSKHLEQIRTSLNRIETFLSQQDEKNAISCALPIEKLYALLGDLSTSVGDGNEFKEPNLSQVRRALGIDSYVLKQLLKKQRRQSNDFSDSDEDEDDIFNAIANTNANTNMNTNINANQHSRRTLSSKLPSILTALSGNTNKNQNFNSNLNVNSNKNKGRYDGSDESDY